jgi:hypothetical protein
LLALALGALPSVASAQAVSLRVEAACAREVPPWALEEALSVELASYGATLVPFGEHAVSLELVPPCDAGLAQLVVTRQTEQRVSVSLRDHDESVRIRALAMLLADLALSEDPAHAPPVVPADGGDLPTEARPSSHAALDLSAPDADRRVPQKPDVVALGLSLTSLTTSGPTLLVGASLQGTWLSHVGSELWLGGELSLRWASTSLELALGRVELHVADAHAELVLSRSLGVVWLGGSVGLFGGAALGRGVPAHDSVRGSLAILEQLGIQGLARADFWLSETWLLGARAGVEVVLVGPRFLAGDAWSLDRQLAFRAELSLGVRVLP